MLAGVHAQGELQHHDDDTADSQDPSESEHHDYDGGDTGWEHDPTHYAAGDTGAEFEMAGGQTWYAACESGHPFWADADRHTYEAAEVDARAHDRDHHHGEETAVVLS